MHELSLCQSMMDIINDQVDQLKVQRLTKVYLEMGQLAGIDKAALLFSFNVVTLNTFAEQAELEILDIAGQARCNSCKRTVPVQHYYDACPHCQTYDLTITQGEELRIKSIEVE